MVRRLSTLALLLPLCLTQAASASPECDRVQTQAMAEQSAADRSECLRLTLLSGQQGADIASDLVQAIGQAVVDRAVQSGWTILRDRLSELAGCDVKAPKKPTLPATCDVLGKTRIQDLLASPRILLRAAIQDIFDLIKGLVGGAIPTDLQLSASLDLTDLIADAERAWHLGGQEAFASSLYPHLDRKLRSLGPATSCPSSNVGEKALWVCAQCLMEVKNPKNVLSCSWDRWVGQCGADDQEKAVVRQFFLLLSNAFTGQKDKVPRIVLDFYFALADLEVEKIADAQKKQLAGQFFQGLHALLLGLVDEDWTEATTGAVELLEAAATIATKPTPLDARLLKLLGSIGQYAQTYQTQGAGSANPAEARAKIIEDLVTSLVRRTDRDSGAVLSLGGSFGFLFGKRGNNSSFDQTQAATPFQLGLGVGLQTYHTHTLGFHLMLNFFDLGQYTAYQSGNFMVQKPELESALVVGATAGMWFLSRETPVVVGGYFGVSPFVRVNDQPTYQAGAVLSVYVPLLDFN